MTRTYGTLDWTDTTGRGTWLLRAEPHVVLRAKRLFHQVSKGAQGGLALTDTPHVAKDLAWFLMRYPVVIDATTQARLDSQVQAADDMATAVQAIFDRTAQLPTFDLAVPARKYQAEAATMVLATGRLLVGDALGLGKTATAIAVLTDQRARPAVAVTLTHLPKQWERELNRFAPQLRVFLPKTGTPSDKDVVRMREADVVVLNYAKLAGWSQTLAETFGARTVVFDEVQELRRGTDSAKGQAAAALAAACAFRIGLSATPVYNYGGEIWNLFNVLAPGALGTRSEFSMEWGSEVDNHGNIRVKQPKELGSYLRDAGLFLRRTIDDVVDEVPALAEPIRVPHLIDSNADQIIAAKTAAADLARVILSATATGRDKMMAAGEMDWRLRQATGIAKAPFVAAFVRMLLHSEERVVLFGWHRAVYELWKEDLREFQPVFFTGEESPTQKEHAREEFIAGKSRVLIMSLRAGAGLDGLQACCRTAVFGELDWSPGVHEQCIGRLHRPGQENVVQSFFLHAEDGSDPVIVEVLGLKKAQARGIVDPNAPLLEQPKDTTNHIRMLAEQCLRAAAATTTEGAA